MAEDTRKDRLIASAACFVLAAMLACVAIWLGTGMLAAGGDYERFHSPDARMNRTERDLGSFIVIAGIVGGLSAIGSLGLAALGVWTLVSKPKS